MEEDEEFDLKTYLDRLHTLKDKGSAPAPAKPEKKSVSELDEELEKLFRQTLDAGEKDEEDDILSSALKRFELCTKDATRDLQPISEELEKRLNKIMSKKKKSTSSSYLKLHRPLTRSGVRMGVWDVTSRSEQVRWTNDANDNIGHVVEQSTAAQ